MPALQNITNTSPLRSRLPIDAADCALAPKADAVDPSPPELREALRRAARAECQVQELLAALALMESEGCRPRPATVDEGCQPDDGFLALAPALPPPLASPKDTILGLALKLHELRAENHLLRAANAARAPPLAEPHTRGEAKCAVGAEMPRPAAGIPDTVFMVGKHAVQNTCSMLNFMPTSILISKLCPVGVESTVFSLLAGFSNFGTTISMYLGAYVLDWIGLGDIGKGPVDDFRHAWKACLINAVSPLSVLLILPFLIPDARMSAPLATPMMEDVVPFGEDDFALSRRGLALEMEDVGVHAALFTPEADRSPAAGPEDDDAPPSDPLEEEGPTDDKQALTASATD